MKREREQQAIGKQLPEEPRVGWSLNADRPIAGRKADRFQRSDFADALVDQVLALPKNESFVLGLVGPWGSGKTSILKMLEESLVSNDEVAVLEFNPWLFSGTEQLAAHFFQELAAQLHESSDKKLQEAGEMLVGYSEALSPLSALPVVGKWLERIAGSGKFLGALLRRKGGALPASVTLQRRQIEELLAEQGKRLLIIIDDIDRLPKADIREVFKLVRLTADFPNTTYILSFDRARIEDALGETEGEGRAYLEKILQVTFDLPAIRPVELARFLAQEIERAVGDRDHGPFDEAEWLNVFELVIRPLFRTPRDVRRFTNGIPVALKIIGDEIAIVDLLAIEAVRCMMPDVWTEIQSCSDVLTNTSDRSYGTDARLEQDKAKFDALLRAGKEHRDAVKQFCSRVFPASRKFIDNHDYGPEWSQRWRKERRLANADVLRFYFEKSLPGNVLRSTAVRAVFDKLGDESALRSMLDTYNPETIEHVCDRLGEYQDEFLPQVVESALVAFFEQYPRLREGARGWGDFGAAMTLSVLGLRLLKPVHDERERNEIANRAVSKIRSLSARRQFLDLIGWHKNAGHRLVSQATSAQLEVDLDEAILRETPGRLGKERDLVWLLQRTDDGGPRVPALARAAAADDSFMLRLLRSGFQEGMSRTIGDVAGRRRATLPWDYLVELLGNEALVTRVEALNHRREELGLDERGQRALDAAVRYSGGWRPGRFMEDLHVEGTSASDEELAEERKYRPELLVELLESVVPNKRDIARQRLAHRAEIGADVSGAVFDALAVRVINGDTDEERAAFLSVLRRLNGHDRVLAPLTQQWFTLPHVGALLSEGIGECYRDRPDRLPELVTALERVPLETLRVERVRDGLLTVATILERRDHDEVALDRVVEVVQRFGDIALLAPLVEQVRLARTHDTA